MTLLVLNQVSNLPRRVRHRRESLQQIRSNMNFHTPTGATGKLLHKAQSPPHRISERSQKHQPEELPSMRRQSICPYLVCLHVTKSSTASAKLAGDRIQRPPFSKYSLSLSPSTLSPFNASVDDLKHANDGHPSFQLLKKLKHRISSKNGNTSSFFSDWQR